MAEIHSHIMTERLQEFYEQALCDFQQQKAKSKVWFHSNNAAWDTG